MILVLLTLTVSLPASLAQDGFPTLSKLSATANTVVFGYTVSGDTSAVAQLRVIITASDVPDTSFDAIVDLSKDQHTLTNLRPGVQYNLFPQVTLKSQSVVQGVPLKVKTASLPSPNEKEKDDKGPSVGVIVGIVVGSIICLVLVVAAFIIGFRYSKKQKKAVEYRVCDSKTYTGDDKDNPQAVEIDAQWEDVDQLIRQSSSKPPESKHRSSPQAATGVKADERAPMNQAEQHEPTAPVSEAPAGYRRSYADADVIPRGPSLKYRESLREVTRDKYRNIVRKDRIAEDDDSDDDAWYQNASAANGGKQYPQKSYPAPRSSGYAQPVKTNYTPNSAPSQPPPVQSKGRGKRLPNIPVSQGPPAYSEGEFKSRVAERYGEDESAV